MHVVIAHFGSHYVKNPGGVENVICRLANALVHQGDEVTILYRDDKEGDPYFPLDKKVVQKNILFEGGRKVISEKLPAGYRILRELSRLFSQTEAQKINVKYKGKQYGKQIKNYLLNHPADVILSCSIPSTKYVVDDAACKVPVIQMLHSHPKFLFPTLSAIEKNAVKRCQVIQILLPSGLSMVRQFFPEIPAVVIGNAVFPTEKKACPGSKKKKHLISCVGSLTKNKQQHLLCEAFAKLADRYPDWNVELWGYSGHFGNRVQSWIDKHALTDRILIKGQTTHVEDVYARSDIFCLPSRAEGWGLGLTEAMAAGVPAVGFKGCTGVEDLIQDGVTGLLADHNDINSLAASLQFLMDHPQKRQEMGEKAAESMKQFSPDKIWNLWKELLKNVDEGRI